MMLKSMECLGLQRHNGARPVLIGCMVLKVELTFLIPSSKALCLVEASYLVEDIKSNTSISRTIQSIKYLILDLHSCVIEDLYFQ